MLTESHCICTDWIFDIHLVEPIGWRHYEINKSFSRQPTNSGYSSDVMFLIIRIVYNVNPDKTLQPSIYAACGRNFLQPNMLVSVMLTKRFRSSSALLVYNYHLIILLLVQPSKSDPGRVLSMNWDNWIDWNLAVKLGYYILYIFYIEHLFKSYDFCALYLYLNIWHSFHLQQQSTTIQQMLSLNIV